MLAPERHRMRFLLLAALFALATGAAFWIDLMVARWADANGFQRLGDLDLLITWSEVFGHGVGVTVILVTVFVLDADHRRYILRLAVLAHGAGLVTAVAKRLVDRTRPMHFDLSRDAIDTFAFRFPDFLGDDHDSFPSGHTTSAVGLAIGLAWRYPRGRWLFFIFALGAAAQRWSYRVHYVSDSCAGAVVACLVAAFVLGKSPLQRWLERFEQKGASTAAVPAPTRDGESLRPKQWWAVDPRTDSPTAVETAAHNRRDRSA